jgi:hypothetical protein
MLDERNQRREWEALKRSDGPIRIVIDEVAIPRREADAIERGVMRRCGHSIHAELIRLAVHDAVEQRKPRW